MLILIITIGVSFAYFTANLTGGEDSTTITVTGGSMNIYYNKGSNINIANIIPSNEAAAIKTFTLTGNNTTDIDMIYSAILIVEENTFSSSALKYKLISSGDIDEVIPSIADYKNILHGEREIHLGTGVFSGKVTDKVHTYNLEIYFPDTSVKQNIDQGKTFSGYIKIVEGDNQLEIPDYYVLATDDDFDIFTIENWIYDEEDGYYQDGYIDIQQYVGDDDYIIIPEYINDNLVTSAYGMFGVVFEWDNEESENRTYYSTTVKGVATLNSNITNMINMFYENESTTLELKYLDTSNVTDMDSIFSYNKATTLDLSLWDTSKVTDMGGMFQSSQATSIDLSSFDTSNVSDMSRMFNSSQITTLDLSSFDTSNVTDMSWMLSGSQTTNLDLSIFNTANVTNMNGIFYQSQASTLDLSSFDTSNVIDMGWMFCDSEATSIDLSSFDTSSVTDMSLMFSKSQATSLDLSSFDTSNVTDMRVMFSDSQVITLDLRSFVTSNVTNMHQMFDGSQATSLDLSSFDTSSVISMDFMFAGSQATTGYARTLADANRFNSSIYKPAGLTFIVK